MSLTGSDFISVEVNTVTERARSENVIGVLPAVTIISSRLYCFSCADTNNKGKSKNKKSLYNIIPFENEKSV